MKPLFKKYFFFSVFTMMIIVSSCASKKGIINQIAKLSLSEDMAKTVMTIWADSLLMEEGKPVKWAYDQGVVLEGIANIWKRTGEGKYFSYIQKSMDFFVKNDGTIDRYKLTDYNIDNIKNGRSLLLLYQVTGKDKYYKAASYLRKQLEGQPRTKEGGFWHKKVYPYQMWLDGLYMGEPFYTEYAKNFHQNEAFDDIANQFIYMEKHARDPKSGLLYHGWDESKEQAWADKTTGNSPNFWGRAMGWYGMALVDVLENFPTDHPKRQELIDVLNRFAAATANVQDKKSGLWYEVLDQPNGKGNYLEASAANMFVYALAKGVRLGYLSNNYEAVAEKGYKGIQKEFLARDAQGLLHLNGTVSVAGLGGKPYRDGSYEYYLSEKVVQDDPKGVGAFLLASNEMELRNIQQIGKNKTVLLDNYFNNETRKDIIGKPESFHYVWNEWDNNGFGILGESIRNMGAKTETLKEGPTASNLANSSVYIIVDPDSKKETEFPHYMMAPYIQNIFEWVKEGGVLLLMANDSSNCELPHFNDLARQFGMQFKYELKNPVTGSQFDMGMIKISEGNAVFPSGPQTYLKEISTLDLTTPARAVVQNKGDVIMASAKLGKGTVFAVGDPWLYNEYTDGRKLPNTFQNLTAAKELMYWLLKQVPNK
ncbi:glucuronyl hydrolase [Pedobacter psychrophilus]|uniref:Glucuronyl hydrolase n=1 Tax=Pedobacter psychrophilus TaxID=1826909 RepID=A0A179DBS7_9SPHI|nr:glycoside hydrolase family 88 protein [Pedobacter psychrophilus]OAQ37913.1 glucuronyl hydrolase [Pedobacter psychrophilus]